MRSVKISPNLSAFSFQLSARSRLCFSTFFAPKVLLLILVFQLLLPSCAISADYKLITSVAGIYEYNDNIFFDDDTVISDSIYTVAPRLEWVRAGERLTARADGKVEFYRYQDNDELDDTDQWYNASLGYQLTERWQVSAQGHVSDDNRPDRDIETTGLVLGSVRRKRSNVGASASYMISEMTSAGVYAEFNRENFDDPETSDRKDCSVVLFMNRSLERWLARTTGRLNLSYSHYTFDREYDYENDLGVYDMVITIDDELEMDSTSLTVGTETALTEKFDLTVDLGARHSRSERVVAQTLSYYWDADDPSTLIGRSVYPNEDDYDSFGFVGSLDATYRGERSSCTLSLSHDLQPVSGDNAAVNRTTVRLGGNLRLLERLTISGFLQWYLNVSDEDDPTQDDTDEQTWNAGGSLRWKLNDTFDLAANYGYTFRDDREDDTTTHRSKVLLQLIASHDWLR